MRRLPIFIIWLIYILLFESAAQNIVRDAHYQLNPAYQSTLSTINPDVKQVSPWLRWDAIYFWDIARKGYHHPELNKITASCFFPLYPMLIRSIHLTTGINPLSIALAISRLALLIAMLLLSELLMTKKPNHTEPRSSKQSDGLVSSMSLLALPVAFILIAPYSEALFLMLFLTVLYSYQRKWLILTAAAISLCICTRIHGLVLLPTSIVLSYQLWHGHKRDRWQAVYPVMGALLGVFMLWLFFTYYFNDPWIYFKNKFYYLPQAAHLSFWQIFSEHAERLILGISHLGFGKFYFILEIPCLILILYTNYDSWRRRDFVQTCYTGFYWMFCLISKSLWGLPRFTMVLPSVIMLLTSTTKHPLLWYTYLVVSGWLQIYLFNNYVGYWWPAP